MEWNHGYLLQRCGVLRSTVGQLSVGQTVNIELGDVQIGELGYYSLQQNPAYLNVVNGKTKKMVCIKYYDNMTPYGPFSAAGDYIIGAPNMTIKNLIIAVWVTG